MSEYQYQFDYRYDGPKTVKDYINLIPGKNQSKFLKTLFELYPDQKENEEGYMLMLMELFEKEPISEKPSCRVVLDRIQTPYDDHYKLEAEDYITIYGLDPKAEEDEFGRSGTEITWAIEYRPWSEWLAMDVEVKADDPRTDDPLKILSHIIWEMSWAGYTEKEVSNQFDNILEIKKDLDENLEKYGHDNCVERGILKKLDIDTLKEIQDLTKDVPE